MVKIRRYYLENAVYFITCVTFKRLPILIDNIDLLRDALDKNAARHQFEILAHVILPDHFHVIIDPGGGNFSDIIQRVKMSFAAQCRKRHAMYSGRVWHNRFWDHVIRDEEDMNRCINYIHYNPVKHGWAKSPFAWVESSASRYLNDGRYEKNWGEREVVIKGEFGE